MKHQQGFSLIEVLVSLVLLIVIVIGFMDTKLKAISISYQQYNDLITKINSQNAIEVSWIARISQEDKSTIKEVISPDV